MPVLASNLFSTNASHYLFRAVTHLAVMALLEYCIFSLAGVSNSPDATPMAATATFFVIPLFLWRFFANFNRYSYFRTARPLNVHSVECLPALKGQEPVKIKLAFQWPADYDSCERPDDQLIRRLPNLEKQIASDMSVALNEYFAALSNTLVTEDPKYVAHFVYPEITLEKVVGVIQKPAEEIFRTMKIAYLKFDVLSIDFPKPKEPPPPAPADRIYL